MARSGSDFYYMQTLGVKRYSICSCRSCSGVMVDDHRLEINIHHSNIPHLDLHIDLQMLFDPTVEIEQAKRQSFVAMKHVNINPTIFIRKYTVASSDDSTWLGEEDYKKIRRGVKKTAQSFRRGEIDETKMTSRGIEHLQSAEDLERQIINKDCAIGVVLSEQRRLSDTGVKIADAAVIISKAYRMHSRWARQNALHLAACDEAFVRSNGNDTIRTVSSSTPAADVRSLDDPSTNSSTSNCLHKLSSLGIESSDEECVGVAIQQRSQETLPHFGGESTPSAWMNHQDSLRLSGNKGKHSGNADEAHESQEA